MGSEGMGRVVHDPGMGSVPDLLTGLGDCNK